MFLKNTEIWKKSIAGRFIVLSFIYKNIISDTDLVYPIHCNLQKNTGLISNNCPIDLEMPELKMAISDNKSIFSSFHLYLIFPCYVMT